MLAGLRLLLPALMPSWRFFDAVTASPRLDFALLAGPDDEAPLWHAFRPRPPHLGFAAMARRMVWNPQWNEALFLVSLAERLVTTDDPHTASHSQRELLLRVARHLDRNRKESGLPEGPLPSLWLQIRLRLVQRAEGPHSLSDETGAIDNIIPYHSTPWPLADLLTR